MSKKYNICYNYKQSGGIIGIGIAGYELKKLFDDYWWITLRDNLFTTNGFECYYLSGHDDYNFSEKLSNLLNSLNNQKDIDSHKNNQKEIDEQMQKESLTMQGKENKIKQESLVSQENQMEQKSSVTLEIDNQKESDIKNIFELTIFYLQGLDENNYVISDNIINCNLFNMLVDMYKKKYKIYKFIKEEKKIWQVAFNSKFNSDEKCHFIKMTLPLDKMLETGLYKFTPMKLRNDDIKINNIKSTETFVESYDKEYSSFYKGYIDKNEIDVSYENNEINKALECTVSKFPNTTDETCMAISLFDKEVQYLKDIKSCNELRLQVDKYNIPITDNEIKKKVVIKCSSDKIIKKSCERGSYGPSCEEEGEQYFEGNSIKLDYVDFSNDAKHDNSPFKNPVNFLRNHNKLIELYKKKKNINLKDINLKDILQYIKNKNLFLLEGSYIDLKKKEKVELEYKIRKFFCDEINRKLKQQS